MSTPHHFFLSSAGTWMTTNPSRSLTQAIKMMEREKLTFNIFFVPVAHDVDYDINWFAPQVAGAFVVDTVEFKKGRRVQAGKE